VIFLVIILDLFIHIMNVGFQSLNDRQRFGAWRQWRKIEDEALDLDDT